VLQVGRRRISKPLLPLGSALEPERLTVTLGKLTDDTEREVIRLLYGERAKLPGPRRL
jgi:hypothetical protein